MNNRRNKKIPVLIPDGESLVTLWVINCLSEDKDIEIHLVSSKKWVESRFSKHISSFVYYPQSKTLNERYRFLEKRIQKLDIQVLLPVIVPSIRFVAKYKKNFEALGLTIVTPETTNLDLGNCKESLAKFLKKNGLPHPNTCALTDQKNLQLLSFPVLIKPLSSWNGKGFQLLKSKEELTKLDLNHDRLIAQEYLIGMNYCVNVICEQGKIKQHTIQKGILPNKFPFRPDLGVEFVEDEKLLNIVEKVMAKLNWTGVANFDILREDATGAFYIIEMNPRFWGSVEASQRVGVNFPLLYVDASLGKKLEAKTYRLERYISNKGIVKMILHIFTFQWERLYFPKNHSLTIALQDPLPKAFKYSKKILLKLMRRSINSSSKKDLGNNIAS